MSDQLPKSIEAEEATIGGSLVDPDQFYELDGFLDPKDFSITHHKWIYDAALTLHRNNHPVDLITMMDELQRREFLKEIPDGISYLTQLMDRTPSSLHTVHYAKIVKRTAALRRLIIALTKAVQIAHADNGELSEIMAEVSSVVTPAMSDSISKEASDVGELVSDIYDKTVERSQSDTEMLGLPTGLKSLDKMTLGLVKTDLVVLAGRPGMGKSALAFSTIGLSNWLDGKAVSGFSMEMSAEQLTMRLLSSDSGVDLEKIRLGKMSSDEWRAYQASVDKFSNNKARFIIDDTPALSVFDLRSKAIKHVAEGAELIIVDYLQLMRAGKKTNNRTEEVGFISRSLKALAKELKVPVLALSQLNRGLESRQDKRPRLSDLRESGEIEQDSDVVLFIYRDEIYDPATEFPNVAEIIAAKHRQGKTGAVSCYFRKHLTQFVDLEIRTTQLDW